MARRGGGPPSVLDDLGEEITGIAAPVAICMALVVLLVRVLNPEGMADTATVFIATMAYTEQPGDSAGTKLGGALLNALIFVCVVAGTTFVLFFLFKYRCYKVIYGYMGFAVFDMYFVLTGAIGLRLLQVLGVHIDTFSLCFILFNFSVVGVVGLFFAPVPLLLKQGYLVWTGIVTAFLFTYIPEWTSWVLLALMALYDLAAVLAPGGPLKVLVELAIERNQELPALVYEARPSGGRPYRRGWHRHRAAAGEGGAADAAAAAGADASPSHSTALLSGAARSSDGGDGGRGAWLAGSGGGGGAAGEGLQLASSPRAVPPGAEQRGGLDGGGAGSSGSGSSGGGGRGERRARSGLRSRSPTGGAAPRPAAAAAPPVAAAIDPAPPAGPPVATSGGGGAAGVPGGGASGSGASGSGAAGVGGGGGVVVAVEEEEDDEDMELPDSIKLGLGDFIFYSMLVGRAAMYDMMTVYASFLAIIAGLGITLLLLALARKALPALPVSIALGVAFYFLTRLVMEPFAIPLALNGVFY